MSAGKGDLPRPVDGAVYRSNYDAIFRSKTIAEDDDLPEMESEESEESEEPEEIDFMREFKDWRDHQDTFDFDAFERRLYGEY